MAYGLWPKVLGLHFGVIARVLDRFLDGAGGERIGRFYSRFADLDIADGDTRDGLERLFDGADAVAAVHAVDGDGVGRHGSILVYPPPLFKLWQRSGVLRPRQQTGGKRKGKCEGRRAGPGEQALV